MKILEKNRFRRSGFWLRLFPQLRYRLPKAVAQIRVFENRHSYYICPECGASLDREYMAFCDSCGQRLSWVFCDKATSIYISPKKQ